MKTFTAVNAKEGFQFELNYLLTLWQMFVKVSKQYNCISRRLFLFSRLKRRLMFYFTLFGFGKDGLHFDVSLRSF